MATVSTITLAPYCSLALVETLVPPTIAANGRAGVSRTLVSASTSSAKVRPA
jgi:hypothetical protein